MPEVLTLAEIYERFDSEWVLLEDPELDRHQQIVRGKVLWHSKDRDEIDRVMLERRPKHGATLYTGKIPDDMAVIL